MREQACWLRLSLILIALNLPAPIARAETHRALVIGINKYINLGPERNLEKAVGDARSVAGAFRSLGFSVTEAEDTTRADLIRLWSDFLSKLQPGDVAAFYFSGHGVEKDGFNFLIPSDIPALGPNEGERLGLEALSFETLMSGLRDRKTRVSLIILDACRNNPFPDRRGRSLGSIGGLAQVEPPEGTFVLYSAGVGQMALDRLSDTDSNPNSVFTRNLLPLIQVRGLTLTDLARTLKEQVRSLALTASPTHQQTPAYYDEVIGDFCLAGCTGKAPASPVLLPPQKVEPAVGSIFRDCDRCPEMVVVPSGTFLMGSDKSSDPDSDPTETPAHLVQISHPIAVGRFEVTFQDWDNCVESGGCNAYKPSDSDWGRGRQPVINVSWADAKSYVAWLATKTSKPYRLLSEAEWEYAARAGSKIRYSSGDDPAQLCLFANGADRATVAAHIRNETCEDGFADRAAPVGQFKPNGFGLYDTIGNVWEWVEDCWHDRLERGPANPNSRSEPACTKHVIRGGSWLVGPIGLRSAMRAGIDANYRDDDVGFRVMRGLHF